MKPRSGKKLQECRIGMPGYARIVAAMPGTVPQIAERAGLSEYGVGKIIRELRALGALYQAGVTKGKPRSSPVRVWAVGPGPVTLTTRPRVGVIAFARLLDEISEPSSITEIVEETGISNQTARRAIHALRALGVSHIAGWQVLPIGPRVAMHVFGPGKDAKPKPATSRVIVQRRMRQRRAQQKAGLQQFAAAIAANSERAAA